MSTIQVKNVPTELHEQLRARAATAGMTVRDYVLNLIRRDLAVPSKQEWLERLSGRGSERVTGAARVLDEERARR